MVYLKNVGTILVDPSETYTFEQLNAASTFNDDIIVEEGSRVNLSFTEVTGNLTFNNVKDFKAPKLQTVNGILTITNCERVDLSNLASVSVLMLQDIGTVLLPSLTDCPLIELENINCVKLPKLTHSDMIVAASQSVETPATGTLYHAFVKEYNCPNMKIQNFKEDPVFILEGCLYHTTKTVQISNDIRIYHIINKEKKDRRVKLVYKDGILGINALTEEEALQLLQEQLEK